MSKETDTKTSDTKSAHDKPVADAVAVADINKNDLLERIYHALYDVGLATMVNRYDATQLYSNCNVIKNIIAECTDDFRLTEKHDCEYELSVSVDNTEHPVLSLTFEKNDQIIHSFVDCVNDYTGTLYAIEFIVYNYELNEIYYYELLTFLYSTTKIREGVATKMLYNDWYDMQGAHYMETSSHELFLASHKLEIVDLNMNAIKLVNDLL